MVQGITHEVEGESMEKWTKEQIDRTQRIIYRRGCRPVSVTCEDRDCIFWRVMGRCPFLVNDTAPANEIFTNAHEEVIKNLLAQHEHDADADETEVSDTQQRIVALLDAVKDLLLYKNKLYGDSALHPAGIFYKGKADDSICLRLDDKLNRIKNNPDAPRINDALDSLGYHVLYLVKRMEDEDVLAAIEKEKD